MYRSKILLLVFSISFLSFSQTKLNQEVHLKETFGFVKAQEFLLTIIESKYPELLPETTVNRLAFNQSFDRAIHTLHIKMKVAQGESYNSVLANMEQIAKVNFGEISKEDALLFIAKVKRRAKGTITSPYLETLLTYQYFENPVEELNDNYYRLHTNVNLKNSLITTLTARLPASWHELSSSDSPIALKKFRSEAGQGAEFITISRLGLSITTKSSDDLIQEEIQKFIPHKATIITTNSKIIDDRLIYEIQYQDTHSTSDTKLNRHAFLYAFEYLDHLLVIDCSIYRNMGASFNTNKFEPLFQAIAKSVKFESSLTTRDALISNYRQH